MEKTPYGWTSKEAIENWCGDESCVDWSSLRNFEYSRRTFSLRAKGCTLIWSTKEAPNISKSSCWLQDNFVCTLSNAETESVLSQSVHLPSSWRQPCFSLTMFCIHCESFDMKNYLKAGLVEKLSPPEMISIALWVMTFKTCMKSTK